MRRIAVLTFVLITIAVGRATTAPTVTVVMSGLDNPRGLAFGPEGALYVAEAGRGGSGPCSTMRAMLMCYGPTGALTRLWRGTQERVTDDLPSYVNPIGEATGPHDISFQGRGGAYVTIGFGGDPTARPSLLGPFGVRFGTLVVVGPDGRWHVDADVSAYEGQANPDHGPVDTNPYGALAEPGARIVADAGANALLRVKANGDISTVAVFPTRASGRSTDAVPTSVVVGPDGAYYVGELTGVPFTAGAARVYRVVPGAAPQVIHEGFKTIIDLDFGPDGSLYVLQHATGATFFSGPGELWRVAPNGTRSLVLGGLTRPTSVVVGTDGAIYVSNRGTSIGIGEVLKIQP